jgi:hypothetical protein
LAKFIQTMRAKVLILGTRGSWRQIFSGLLMLSGCRPALPPVSEPELMTELEQQARSEGLGPKSGPIRILWPQTAAQAFKQAYLGGIGYGWSLSGKTVMIRKPQIFHRTWPCGLHSGKLPFTNSRHLTSLWNPVPQQVRGDLVNLLIRADSRQQIALSFQAAGWTPPDLTDYLEDPWAQENAFPVSRLFLWGRSQDLAFSRDTSFNLSHRHHLRLWKSPWRCGASEIWVATASQDQGIEWNHFGWRGGPTTHRIDPDLDRERDVVLGTFKALHLPSAHLMRTGLFEPVEGLNGNLDPYVSNGQLAWLDLTASGF